MARKWKKSATQESSTPPLNLTNNASAAKWLEQHRAKPQLQPGSTWRRRETGQRVQLTGQEKRAGKLFVLFTWLEAAPPYCAVGDSGSWRRAAFLEEFELEQTAQPSTPVDSQSHSVDCAQPAAEGTQGGGEIGTRRAQGASMRKRGKSSSKASNPEVFSYWRLKAQAAITATVLSVFYERARWRVTIRQAFVGERTMLRAAFFEEFEPVKDAQPEQGNAPAVEPLVVGEACSATVSEGPGFHLCALPKEHAGPHGWEKTEPSPAHRATVAPPLGSAGPGASTLDLWTLRDLLSLVDREVPLAVLADWTDAQREAASIWAGRAYVAASDHDDIEVPAEPAWVSAFRPTPKVHPEVLAELEKAGQAIGEEDAADLLRANGLNWQGMPVPTFSTKSAGKVLVGVTGRVHSLWCDGCRQSPTMSVEQAARDKDREHKGCPAGNGTWRLIAEVAPEGGGVEWSAVLAARGVCERVFYWLGMGDEGPEADLPCPEEIASLPCAVAELLEQARSAARMLGGLREGDEHAEEGALCNPPACTLPLHHEGMCPEAPPADVCAVLNPNGSGFWCELPKGHPEDDHAAQVEVLTRLCWQRIHGTPTPGEWEVHEDAGGLFLRAGTVAVTSRGVTDADKRRAEFVANFRLMAGAPRMAHVLEHKVLPLLRHIVDDVGPEPSTQSVVQCLRDVVFALQQAGKEVRHVG